MNCCVPTRIPFRSNVLNPPNQTSVRPPRAWTTVATVSGPIDRARARRLGADSVFEIASLSKVFTALLLADFAVRGANFGQMLVLVDGVRLNDAQSGHHNGDIPVPLDAVERIEVLHGPGSSLFGADAFGGTVNVITRRVVEAPSLVVQGGSFGSEQVPIPEPGALGLLGIGAAMLLGRRLKRVA